MTLLAAEAVEHTSNDWQLILAALLGIAVVVVLITWLKVHPFLALILGSAVIGVVAGMARRTSSPASAPGSGRRSAGSVC